MTNNPQQPNHNQPNQNQTNINPVQKHISLRYDDKQFAEFVFSLLGKPQTLEKSIYGNFDIKLNEIINFHNLLDQRISQQNHAQLIQFKATINFKSVSENNDYTRESSIILSNFDELESYNETRPLVSESISLSWIYLVQFNDKSTPEKQEIDVFIGTKGDIIKNSNNFQSNLTRIRIVKKSGIFKLSVRCTAHSWGNDIIELFTREVAILIRNKSSFEKLSKVFIPWFGIFSVTLFTFVSGIIHNKIESELIALGVSQFKNTVSQNLSINQLLELLLKYIVEYSANSIKMSVANYDFLAILLFTILAFTLFNFGTHKRPSFLVLTRKDIKQRARMLNNNKLNWILFFLSVPVSLFVNIASSFLFLYMTTK
jgi:hypothetical protein